MKNYFLLILGCLCAHIQLFAQLDPNFNGTGYVLQDFGFHDNANHILMQPDQKILVTGVSLSTAYIGELKVIRLKTNGQLDSTFGINGVFSLPLAGESYGVSAAFAPDGNIIIGGLFISTTTGYSDMLLAKITPNGQLVSSFGNNGWILHNFTPEDDLLQAMAIQTDGKIVVSGTISQTVGFDLFNMPALVRFLPNGSVDSTFGVNGKTIFNAEGIDNELTSCMIQADGKIIASGHFQRTFTGATDFDALVVRTNSNGAPDTGFGQNNGQVITTINAGIDDIFGMDLDANGNIVLGGFTTAPVSLEYDYLLLRYLPNGNLDTSFGNNGMNILDSMETEYIMDIKVQNDGKIVAVGAVGSSFVSKSLALLRFLPNGNIDKIIQNDLPTYSIHEFTSVALQNNGAIVATGKALKDNNDILVCRYEASLSKLVNITAQHFLSIYPNPVPKQTELHFSLTKDWDLRGAQLEFLDEQGRVLFAKPFNEYDFTQNISLPSGLYFYHISNEKEQFYGKVWVKE